MPLPLLLLLLGAPLSLARDLCQGTACVCTHSPTITAVCRGEDVKVGLSYIVHFWFCLALNMALDLNCSLVKVTLTHLPIQHTL